MTLGYRRIIHPRNFGFGNQIHVGQFFGASFKIIDKGSIRWFAAVGFSMDSFIYTTNLPYPKRRFNLAIGPELNCYFTYMFNPSFGLSLGGNFAYYWHPLTDRSGPSGGFGIFVTFAPQGVKPRAHRSLHGDR